MEIEITNWYEVVMASDGMLVATYIYSLSDPAIRPNAVSIRSNHLPYLVCEDNIYDWG